jgi:pimeloyl-ACP methyl ester carboxylesterase
MRWTFCVLLAGGCVFFRSASVPMPTVLHAAPAGEADRLVVLLPGLADAPEDFDTQGFVAAIHAVDPLADVIAADAHFGYYRTRTLPQRLHADVLAPLAGRYRETWFVGISMGGLGGSIYAEDHPGTITGLILLAPYLGEGVLDTVRQAGGLARWTPTPLDQVGDENERRFHQLWAWYRGYLDEAPARPRLYLGYGAADDFAPGNAMLGAALPESQVLVLPGDHDWSVWRPLFETLVSRALRR